LEADAAIVVLLACGFEVKVGEGDFAGVSCSQIEEGRADDGVVPKFHSVTIFEDGEGWRLRRNVFGKSVCVRCGNRIHWRDVGVFARSAAIEDSRSALVVSVIVGVGIIVRAAAVDRICIGNGISISQRGSDLAGMVTVMGCSVVVGFVP